MNDFDLLMAIFNEHRQRTGHDVMTEPTLGTLKITCDVCLYLDTLMKRAEEEMFPPERVEDEEPVRCLRCAIVAREPHIVRILGKVWCSPACQIADPRSREETKT